jgi:pSer/pThr/pTyr-binding forkhead associated (FHA) protein
MGNTPMQTLAVQPATSLSGSTKIIEDRKTKLIDAGRVRLEIIKREGPAEVIALKEGEYTFGRGQDAQYMLEDGEETVSRVHFKLLVRDSRIRIRDLDSLNGTRVNDVAIEEAELHKGDLIAAGKVQLKVA